MFGMHKVILTTRFSKDVTRCRKRGLKFERLDNIVRMIAENKELPNSCRPHLLKGKYDDYWECHIQPDWLLIYDLTENGLYLIRTGTHSDLF
jgi:mRNA interferase YafQ